jgi:hypothetical protein
MFIIFVFYFKNNDTKENIWHTVPYSALVGIYLPPFFAV